MRIKIAVLLVISTIFPSCERNQSERIEEMEKELVKLRADNAELKKQTRLSGASANDSDASLTSDPTKVDSTKDLNETLDYINQRISFGQNTPANLFQVDNSDPTKLIITYSPQDGFYGQYIFSADMSVFDPDKINVERVDDKMRVLLITSDGLPKVSQLEIATQKSFVSAKLPITLKDRNQLDSVKNALKHLIVLLGGKTSKF